MRLLLCAMIWILSLAPPAAAKDPVSRYIAEADSLARLAKGEILDAYVAQHAILGGAAVGKLLETAFEPGGQGNARTRSETFELAERIARAYERGTGSAKPLQLAAVYRAWTPEQRAVREKAVALDREATESRNGNNLERSVQLYHQARELYNAIGDKRSIAIIHGSLGIAHWNRNDMDSVRANYDKALAARREIEDRILEGRTLNGLGSVSFQKGNYEDAVSFYDQAIALRLKTGDREGLITSYTYRGAVFIRLGDLVQARASFEAALPLLDTAGSVLQKNEIYSNLGSLYTGMGRLKSANESYRNAIELAVASGDPLREAANRINLADNFRIGGRYREALDELDAAQSALERQKDPVQSALLLSNRGEVYLSMGELDRAREDLTAFLRESQSLEDPRHQVDALLSLGDLYRELGAYSNALASALQAKEKAEQLGDRRLGRKALVSACTSEMLLGRYETALEHINEALAWDRAHGMQESAIEDMILEATIKSYMGRLDEGRTSFKAIRGMTNVLGRSELAWAVLFGIGHSFERENPDSAAFYYEQALALVEKTGAAVGGAETQTGFFSEERRRWYEEVTRYYAWLAKGGAERDWSSRAFRTIERAKARGLLELMESSVMQDASPAEEALLDSLYALNTSPGGAIGTRRSIEKRYIAMRETRIRREMGELASSYRIAGIADVQQALPERAILMEYALGDTLSLLWIIGGGKQALFGIPPREAIRTEVTRLRDAVAKPGAGDAALKQAARKLYEMLVKPAESAIAGARQLLIVPDGILFELPFELLLAKDPEEGGAWSDCAFLARSYETVYIPSSSIYLELKKPEREDRFERELIAVGNPDFSTLAAKPGSKGAGVPQLPYTEEEVRAIGSLFPEERRTVLVGAKANEAGFKRTLKEGSARIIHLATHGYADPAEPTESSILLCRDADSNEDGYLHTLEILSLPINSGLVVLSACESGRGRVSRGEGVVGLSRAFFAAGASGVAASLWSVADASSAVLMTAFYENMYSKKRPACEAMKDARQLLMRNPQYAHPFYWAPFILIGTDAMPWGD